ncbi:MAG TPA: Lrp/AsnC family transcriptional regulator [Vicinamibacterales bacterium]
MSSSITSDTIPALRDPITRRILAILSRDGRASYQAIADAVGLSRPAVMERVRRLEEAGYITAYRAVLDRRRLGRAVTAFVAVRYPASDHPGTHPQITALAQHPDVLEAHHVAGEDCYLLKVAAPSLERLEQVIHSLRTPGVPMSTRTTIVLSTVFEKPDVDIPEEES